LSNFKKACGIAGAGSYNLLVRGSCHGAEERRSENRGPFAAQKELRLA
jgi:hypothetical protein